MNTQKRSKMYEYRKVEEKMRKESRSVESRVLKDPG